jgi:hypothetical protein
MAHMCRNKSKESQRGIQKFQERVRINKCFGTDGSKMNHKAVVGFASIDIKDDRRMKFRISETASTVTAEALAIGETLEIIANIDSEQNFLMISDSTSVLQGISNSSTMNNTSHITHMLKDIVACCANSRRRTSVYSSFLGGARSHASPRNTEMARA